MMQKQLCSVLETTKQDSEFDSQEWIETSIWTRNMLTALGNGVKGSRVGYITPKDMIVSTYDLGYGDGCMRSNSFKPFITAQGLPILGRVSMDYISLETDIDEVCIFDNAQDASKQIGTISYEIMTQLSMEIPRVI